MSIARLMLAVAILALDGWLLRLLLSHGGPDSAAFYGPIGLCVQVGCWQAVHQPSGRRSFWIGFLAAGIVVVIGSAALDTIRPKPVDALWVAYLRQLGRSFGRLPPLGAGYPGHEWLHFAVVALFFFPAQVLLAVSGGIVGQGLARRQRDCLSSRLEPGPANEG